jgi:hypothetical protein
VTTPVWFWPIFVFRTAVQELKIVDQLNVAWTKIHFEFELLLIRERHHRVERFDLAVRQSGYLLEPLSAMNEAWIIAGENAVSCWYKCGHYETRFLTFNDFTPSI